MCECLDSVSVVSKRCGSSETSVSLGVRVSVMVRVRVVRLPTPLPWNIIWTSLITLIPVKRRTTVGTMFPRFIPHNYLRRCYRSTDPNRDVVGVVGESTASRDHMPNASAASTASRDQVINASASSTHIDTEFDCFDMLNESLTEDILSVST